MGSSPPARGPQFHIIIGALVSRLIPACAGTTHRFHCNRRVVGAHPRLRGDHQFPPYPRKSYPGSSPPARGPPSLSRNAGVCPRLTPACAGTTVVGLTRGSVEWAHPRLRGDHSPSGTTNPVALGSSPPARGPPVHENVISKLWGLIPACAGTTSPTMKDTFPLWAHPRLRGDHFLDVFGQLPSRGSSPPARGPLVTPSGISREIRLIPACAGTTSTRERD